MIVVKVNYGKHTRKWLEMLEYLKLKRAVKVAAAAASSRDKIHFRAI